MNEIYFKIYTHIFLTTVFSSTLFFAVSLEYRTMPGSGKVFTKLLSD